MRSRFFGIFLSLAFAFTLVGFSFSASAQSMEEEIGPQEMSPECVKAYKKIRRQIELGISAYKNTMGAMDLGVPILDELDALRKKIIVDKLEDIANLLYRNNCLDLDSK